VPPAARLRARVMASWCGAMLGPAENHAGKPAGAGPRRGVGARPPVRWAPRTRQRRFCALLSAGPGDHGQNGGLMVTSSVTSPDQRCPDLRESGNLIVTSYAPGNRRSRDPIHAADLRECKNRDPVPCL